MSVAMFKMKSKRFSAQKFMYVVCIYTLYSATNLSHLLFQFPVTTF